LKLVPFDPELGSLLLKYFIEPEYSHFSRGLGKYPTLEDCRHLPQFTGSEILIFAEDNILRGLVNIGVERLNIYKFSLVLDKEIQGRKLGHLALSKIVDYCFRIKAAKGIICEILKEDYWLGKALENQGFDKCGELPEYDFLNGKYEDVEIYYKRG